MAMSCKSLFDICCQGDIVAARRILSSENVLLSYPEYPFASILHVAVDRDHFDLVKLLLVCGFDANARHSGLTPLHVAALRGNAEVAELLLQFDADVWSFDDCAKTPLILAVEHNSGEDIVRVLLEAGAFPDRTQRLTQYELLKEAIQHGNAGVLEALLENVLNVSELDFDRESLLQVAVIRGRVDCAKLLLRKGAKADPKGNGYNKPSLLRFAIYHDMKDMVQLLLNYGASPIALSNQWINESRQPWVKTLLFSHGSRAGICDNQGNTLLHLECKRGNFKNVQALIQFGAKIGAVNQEGDTALHLSIGNSKIVELLLSYRAFPNPVNCEQLTPLHMACRQGFTATVRVLLRYQADPNSQDNRGQTPLMLAVENNHREICSLLINQGSDVNHKDNNGLTPLHLASETLVNKKLSSKIITLLLNNGAEIDDHLLHAIEFGNIETVQRLLELGAKVEVQDQEGITPLMLATRENRLDAMKLLLSKKANLYARAKDGKTLGHFAAFGLVDPKVMKLLIEHGFDQFNVQDDHGNTAMHLVGPGDCEVLMLMLQNGGDINIKNNMGCATKLYRNPCCKLELCYTLNFFQHLRVVGYKIHDRAEKVLTKELFDANSEKKCKERAADMKNIIVNFSTKMTLYDLLFVNQKHLMRYVNNEVILALWEQLDLNFGLYGRILLRRLTKAKKRSAWVTKATEMLEEAIGSFLPDDCGEQIFKYKSDFEFAVWFPDRSNLV